MGIDYSKRPAAAPVPPPAPPVSLSKVTLTKTAPVVSLTKHGGAGGVLRVNLNWNAKPPERGLFRKGVPLDLDLGCLYEFADGTKGVVQALGNAFTAIDRSGRVLISLDGDDRSGGAVAGENLTVDLSDISRIRRVLVFALIYEGAANWADAQGLVTLLPVNAPPVEIALDEARDGARICAIAMLENAGGEIVVRREVRYLDGAQRALDEAYGWGMNWGPGAQVSGVSLSKGQTVSLRKEGASLQQVRMGLGWDAAKRKGLFGKLRTQTIDLDASALLFDGTGNLVDQVWFQQLRSKDGSIQHTGDNLTGDGEGDDESIKVDLSRVPAQVTSLVFTVNSFTGQDFTQIENAFCRLVDEATGAEIARYDLSGSGTHTAQVMAKMTREGTGWAMTAIGVPASGRTFRDLLPTISAHL